MCTNKIYKLLNQGFTSNSHAAMLSPSYGIA